MNFLRYQIQEQWETWHFWNIQYVTYSRTLIQIWTRKTWEFSSSFALLPTILNWHLVIKGSEINSTLSWMTYPPGRSVRRVVPYDHSMILLLFCLSILGHIFFFQYNWTSDLCRLTSTKTDFDPTIWTILGKYQVIFDFKFFLSESRLISLTKDWIIFKLNNNKKPLKKGYHLPNRGDWWNDTVSFWVRRILDFYKLI